jgi:hypothetical protein
MIFPSTQKLKAMNQTQIFGIIRHALTFGAGYIAAKGWINAGDAPPVVSAVMTLAGVGWSIYEKMETPGGPGTSVAPPPASSAKPASGSTAAMALTLLGCGGLLLAMPGCASTAAGGNSTASVLPQDPATQVTIIAQVALAGTQLGVAAGPHAKT